MVLLNLKLQITAFQLTLTLLKLVKLTRIDILTNRGSDLTISFNPTYLIEALKALKSETVVIRFISPVRPFTLMPGDDAEKLYPINHTGSYKLKIFKETLRINSYTIII